LKTKTQQGGVSNSDSAPVIPPSVSLE